MLIQRRTFLQLTGAAGASVLLTACQGRDEIADAPLDVTYGNDAGYLFFEKSGERFQVDPLAHRVARLSPRGAVLAEYGAFGSGPQDLNAPAAALRGPDGLVYIADRGNSRIQVFEAEGAWVRSLGRRGEGAGELAFPAALAFDRAGDLWVADSLNHRIVILDRVTGAQRASFGTLGERAGELNCPRGLALQADGLAAVLDSGNGRVQLFDRAGRSQGVVELKDRHGRRALSPRAMAGDRLGTLYIADANGGALWRVDAGQASSARRLTGVERRHASPLHVALEPSGALHVVALSAAPAA